MWNHTVLRPGYEAGGETFVGDITLHDEAGHLVGEILGIHLKVAGRDVLRRAVRQGGNDWLYEVEWHPSALLPSLAARSHLPAPERVAQSIASRFEEVADPGTIDEYRQLIPALNELTVSFVIEALVGLGWAPVVGDEVTTDELADRLGVVPAHRRLFGRMLDIVAANGLLRQEGDGTWQVAGALVAEPARAEAARLTTHHAVGIAEVTLTERCGERLADVLSGRVEPLDLLFPGGSAETVESIYYDSPPTTACNAMVGDAVAAAIVALPDDQVIRVLEIGGGTGATTASVLPALPAGRAEYCFTDISPMFTARAEERFADVDQFACAVLDIERDPREQGFAVGQFDIVIASNVLHATADLRCSVEHAGTLLAPGGLLLLVEGTVPNSWVDITFGLTDGWWRFADLDLRPDHPLLDRRRWLDVLKSHGFDEVTTVPSPDQPDRDGLALVIARTATADGAPDEPSSWLVLSDSTGVAAALVEQIAPSGEHVVLLEPDESLEEALGALPDPRCNVVDLRGLDIPGPDGLSAEDVGITQEGPLVGAVAAGQAVLRRASAGTKLWYVTRGAQPVAGDVIAPAQASLWGLGRVIALEQPGIWGGLIDLSPDGLAEGDAAALLAEIRHGGEEDQVALRGGERRVARLVRTTSRGADSVHCSSRRQLPRHRWTRGTRAEGRPVARRARSRQRRACRTHRAACPRELGRPAGGESRGCPSRPDPFDRGTWHDRDDVRRRRRGSHRDDCPRRPLRS